MSFYFGGHYIGCCCLVAKSFNSWDCSPSRPLSMGFPKQRLLEWLSFPLQRSGGGGGGVSSQPRDQTLPALAGGSLPLETPEKPHLYGWDVCYIL